MTVDDGRSVILEVPKETKLRVAKCEKEGQVNDENKDANKLQQ